MKISESKLREVIRNEILSLLEADQPSDANVDKGKMHRVLGIPEDQEISDHYKSGSSLANALAAKVGKAKAMHMLTWAANMTKQDLFKSAKDSLKTNE